MALATTPVRGVFSFPLAIGLLIVGVADLYSCTASGPWSKQLVADATAIAAACARPGRGASWRRPRILDLDLP